jgi:hypothetical protein
MKTDKGDAFIINHEGQGEKINIKHAKSTSSETIRRTDILDEKDTNEIHYD